MQMVGTYKRYFLHVVYSVIIMRNTNSTKNNVKISLVFCFGCYY